MRERKETTVVDMLQKIAWMETVVPILDSNPATKKLTERILRKTVKSQYIPDPTIVGRTDDTTLTTNINQEVL